MQRSPVLLRLVAIATLLAACSSAGTSPAPSSGPAVASSSPTMAEMGEAGDHAPLFPGTYTTQFRPALTLTVGHLVDLDCAVDFRCRGYINVNASSWLDVVFGVDHQAEFAVNRLDKIFDPLATGGLTDPPASVDLAAAIARSPGVAVLQPAKAITLGGLAATQLDVWAHEPLSLGPVPDVDGSDVGFPTEHEIRLIFLEVDGHAVLISEQVGEKNTVHDFQAVLESLQPLIDSITWP